MCGRAQVIGLTGSPGVGKSTTTSALVAAYRKRGQRVGVLAVDPSSPFSGGALLGDRVRMQDHATDAGVFIRSMASRGQLGGLSWATPQALRVLDAAGCDVVLIETVGVGQAEVEIASLADSTVVLLAPGMGDAIQAAKAGILEVADVFVVNKADRDGAEQTVRELKGMLRSASATSPPAAGSRRSCRTVAHRSEGIDDVVDALERPPRSGCRSSGEGERRRQARARGEIEAIALTELRSRMDELRGQAALGELSAAVAQGRLDPYCGRRSADRRRHRIEGNCDSVRGIGDPWIIPARVGTVEGWIVPLSQSCSAPDASDCGRATSGCTRASGGARRAGHFDAAISRVGLIYFPDQQRALAGILAALRPGGRFAGIVYSTPERNPFFSIPVSIIRERGRLAPPVPGQPGPFSLAAPGVAETALDTAGFTHVVAVRIDAPLRMSSAAECVQFEQESFGALHQMLAALSGEEQAAVWNEIRERLTEFDTGDGFSGPCELVVVAGTAPDQM